MRALPIATSCLARLLGACLLVTGVLAGCATPQQGGGDDGAVITGTVRYLARIALPPDATVHVRLVEVGREGAVAATVAERAIPADGRQVPIPFELGYEPSRIDAERRHALLAEIRDGAGTVRWTTEEPQPVLTRGAPSANVEIRVVQSAPQSADAAENPLAGTTWRLSEINTPEGSERPDGDQLSGITFGEDGRLSGRADCNRFSGGYEAAQDGTLEVSQVAATLMACPQPSLGERFLQVLGTASGFEIREGLLRISTDAGEALIFQRASDGGNGARAEPMRPRPTGKTYVFACSDPDGGDFRVTVRTGPGELAVWLPERFGGRYLVLGQARAASGAKYEGDGVVFWNKDQAALLEVGDERFTGCRSDPRAAVWAEARRVGVDFRAIGQEPAWSLEIRDGERMELVADYGQRRITEPAPEPSVDEAAGRTVYRPRTDAGDLVVTIVREPCTDAMSGEQFEYRVTVDTEDKIYRGCGRSLR